MAKIWTIVLISAAIIVMANCQSLSKLDFKLTESEYLTLEGGSMLPDAENVAKVERDVSLIRNKFADVRDIKHNRKWIPGQVITTRISQEQLAKVNGSSFGPLKNIEKIDLAPFFSATVLTFNKPYSPPVLADQLKVEVGVQSSPNAVYYEYEVDNITYRNGNSTYVFKKGTGACDSSCPDRYLWEFKVDNNGEPVLLKEWIVPHDGQRVIIY